MTTQPNIKDANLQGLVCVQLDVHLWSGRKKLRQQDLVAKNPALADLPPESLASMGSIKIADPADLRPFAKLKRQAEQLIRSEGLPMLGTTAIPSAKLTKLFSKLSTLKEKFEQLRMQLEQDYDKRIDKWRTNDKNREWAHLIKFIPSAEYVAGRMTFGMHFSRVSAPSDELSDINKGFHQQLTGLKGELFGDAELEAGRLLASLMAKDGFGFVQKREKITPKTLGPMRRIAEKFRSFAFLDPSVEPLAAMIEHVLALTPSDGPITGMQLVNIWSLARTLADSGKAMEAAALAMSAKTPSEAFESVLSQAESNIGHVESQADDAINTGFMVMPSTVQNDNVLASTTEEHIPPQVPAQNHHQVPDALAALF